MSGLSKMATATYSTRRNPVDDGSGIDPSVAYLTGVKFVPIMPIVQGDGSDRPVRRPPNSAISGTVKKYLTTMAESQPHVENSVAVDKVPDIIRGDTLVTGSDEYTVFEIDNWSATVALLAGVYVTLEESE